MNLQFVVRNQIITRADTEKVVRDSQNYLRAVFSFSDDWSGEKTAVFKSKTGAFNMLLDDDNSCLVPWEVLTDESFEVSVFCGNLITANICKIFSLPSGYEIGEESRTPTEDIFNQIIDKINDIDEKVGDVTMTMTASVDDTSGTPSVEVTKSGQPQSPNFDLAFSGLKGATGDTGATPEISATASVDSTTGTPSVEVTQSGTTAEPSIAFAFSGLKGETGAAGVSPEVTVSTITGGHEVTITDEDHPSGQSFNVLDGADAELPWVTPQDYGAKADGTTDDTDAIVAAEEAANNGSKVLYFPAGTYIVSVNQIRIHAGMTWFGDSGKSVIAMSPTTGQGESDNHPMIQAGTTSTADSGSNITVSDLIFRGSETFGGTQSGALLFGVTDGKNIKFNNCVFQNNKYLALFLVRCSNITVTNCRFEATDCGIEAMGNLPVSDVTIRGCHFTGISSYNGFKNFASEQVAAFCGKDNSDPCERWVVEDCIFEHKSTNGIHFGPSGNLSLSDGVINEKDMVIRNCTFGALKGCVLLQKAENVLIDGIFVMDTAKDSEATYNVDKLIKISASKNVTVRNVTSKCKIFQQNLFELDEYNSGILMDGVDVYSVDRATTNMPLATLKGDNVIIKNFIAHPLPDSNKRIYVVFDKLTDSYIDIRGLKDEGAIVTFNASVSGYASVTGNKFVVNTDADTQRNFTNLYSTTTADANDWILAGDGSYSFGALSGICKERLKKRYIISVNDTTQLNALGSVTDFYLLQDGYDFYLEFVATSYSAGRSFSLNTTGNIIPIDQPITFSNDHKVVCHFVQKSAKWVEAERTFESYAGADVSIETLSAPLTIGSTTVNTVEDALVALAAIVNA